MNTTTKPKLRHPSEAKMLKRALDGDTQAANDALVYLSSANPSLREIMRKTIHDIADDRIWGNLLRCLALKRWDDHLDCERRSDADSSQRIDRAIIEVFSLDESELEGKSKDAALLEFIEDADSNIRQTAAYVLGLRGDTRAIAGLAETLESGTKEAKLRAISALANLKDERCASPLIKLLISDRGELHRDAGRALRSLGELAESAWREVLDHPDSHIRWHAARGLGGIGDTSHATILAEGLRDENATVRWATADVIAHLGEDAVPATLTMLNRYKLDEQFRHAAYHALHGITSYRVQKRLKPLLDALHGSAASVEAPMLAQRLLAEWKKNEA